MAKKFIGFNHRNIIISTLRDVATENNLGMWSDPNDDKKLGFDDWGQIHVSLRKDKDLFAHFMVQQMPGCCAILTLSYVDVNPFTRANFKEVTRLVEDAAKRAGFGSLALTQVLHKDRVLVNEPWGLLLKEDYLISKPFINAKSGNRVVYLTKNLNQDGKIEGLEQEMWA